MTAEILENVKIYVTSTTGAKISGATVTLGSQTVTTGADGLAEFNIKRQSYTLRVTCSGYQSYTESFLVEQETQKRVQIKKV